MEHLPLFLSLKDRQVLVVGGTAMAARRTRMAVEAGARVRVVAGNGLAPDFDECGSFEHMARDFRGSDLDNVVLVFVASDDDALEQTVSRQAQARGLPVNVADRRGLCSFIMPSIVKRAPVTVAVSTAGQAPILARHLRGQLESSLPAGLGRLAEFAGSMRPQINERIEDATRRRHFWERLIEGPVADYVDAGDMDAAEELLNRMLRDETERADTAAANDTQGVVYIVGFGPGDPDLLTFRALRLMQKADVIIIDGKTPPAIMELARRDADRVFVGEKGQGPEQIESHLIAHACDGKRVLWLQPGNPAEANAGGKEIIALKKHNVPFQIVPGISAASC